MSPRPGGRRHRAGPRRCVGILQIFVEHLPVVAVADLVQRNRINVETQEMNRNVTVDAVKPPVWADPTDMFRASAEAAGDVSVNGGQIVVA